MENPSDRNCAGICIDQVDTPALLVDLDKLEFNINLMAQFLSHTKAKLRPHFKTHKSPILAQKQLAAGAIGITCAKVGEAAVLVNAGIKDILIANQVIGAQKISVLMELARQADLIVAVDQEANILELSAASKASGCPLRVLVEVDVGLGRCGVQPGNPALVLAQRIHSVPGLHFSGLLGYEGQAVFMTDRAERQNEVNHAMAKLVSTADVIRKAGLEVEIVSAGGTGTYDMTGIYPGITEIEAGSYILMDSCYQQVGLPFQCGLTLITSVISTPTRGKAIIDAGLKALTIEHGLPLVRKPEGIKILELNEEHGILEFDPNKVLIQVGDKIQIVPSHVCTTVNLHDSFLAVQNNQVMETWPISARGRFR